MLFDPRFLTIYKKVLRNDKHSYKNHVEDQEKLLIKLIQYAYKNVNYYKKTFDKNHLKPSDIKKLEDLEKIPILTKDDIRENLDDFKNRKKLFRYLDYFEFPTGGTTGKPLLYKISRKDRVLSLCLLYRGWSNAGYQLGDKMVLLGGSSLGINPKNKLWQNVQENFRNIKKLSAFDLDKKNMIDYINTINKFEPKFIRGYPSAIYDFCNFIDENNYKIWSPKAIFTTSEVLYPNMRKKIERIFKCKIYDGYGLNDGGVSAYECAQHNGLHIDMDRAILEVVDDNGKKIENGTGKIIATDLNNLIFPFIRYDTGDIGEIVTDKCICGRETPRLTRILGRSVDVLITPEGKKIHGWFFLYIFWKYQKGIKKYRVIQKNINDIEINLVIGNDFDDNQISIIKSIIRERTPTWNVEFKIVEDIKSDYSSKRKFIINEYLEKTNKELNDKIIK